MQRAAARARKSAGERSPRVIGELVWNRLDEQPELRPHVAAFSDAQAYAHFGEDEPLEEEYLRRAVRLFHAWRVHVLRERIGARLANANMLDVGDTDGLILKELGQSGTGFNLSEAAIRNIRANGIEAVGGDAGEGLPFAAHAFDYVLCFETLEHVESPHEVLVELARVCRSDGRVFVSIPWVPVTTFHPRDPSIARGYQHVCELAHDDFHALVTHTPLQVVWEDVCWTLGRPRTIEQRLLKLANRGPTVGGLFRGFQFFELAERTS